MYTICVDDTIVARYRTLRDARHHFTDIAHMNPGCLVELFDAFDNRVCYIHA